MKNISTSSKTVSICHKTFGILLLSSFGLVGCSGQNGLPQASVGTAQPSTQSADSQTQVRFKTTDVGTASPSPSGSAVASPTGTFSPQPGTSGSPAASPVPTSSSSAQPTATASAVPVSPTPTASPVKTNTPATATPTAQATSTPSTPKPTTAPRTNPLVYSPQAGTFTTFNNSIFHRTVPSNIGVDSRSAGWLATIGNGTGSTPFGEFQFGASANPNPNDYMFPIYEENPGNVAYKIHCTAPWGNPTHPYCPAEGMTIHLPPLARPENSTLTGCNGDCHIGMIDQANNREVDLFAVAWPPTPGVLNVAWGGLCSLTNTGYTTCDSTATNNALTQGSLRAVDLVQAVATGGSLPGALAVATKCNYGLNPPFSASDGHCAGGPPEGAHIYLAETLSQINAYNVPAISKVLMRTMAKYGAYITDTNGGASGFSIAGQSGQTYTAVGQANPWLTQFVPEVQKEGWDTGAYNDTYHEVPPMPIQFFRDLRIAPLNAGNTAK